jgi:hypothetical protein
VAVNRGGSDSDTEQEPDGTVNELAKDVAAACLHSRPVKLIVALNESVLRKRLQEAGIEVQKELQTVAEAGSPSQVDCGTNGWIVVSAYTHDPVHKSLLSLNTAGVSELLQRLLGLDTIEPFIIHSESCDTE